MRSLLPSRRTLFVLVLTALVAILAATSVSAQIATKEYKTQPTFLYTFDVDPKSNYAGGSLQSNGSAFEYTIGAGSHYGVLSMDGTQDYLNLARFYDDNNTYFTAAQMGGEMSFEVWVCWTTLDYWSRIFDLAGPSGANDNNIFLSNRWSTSELVFETYVGSANSVLSYTGGVSLYNWQHIVATITNNSASTTASNKAILSLYINGVLVKNTTGYLPTVMARTSSWVGRSNWESSGDARFRGLLDDIFFYNYSLSAEAIVAHYVVPRVPVFELTFAVDPRINMNLVDNAACTYGWVSYLSTDSASNQYAHTGLLSLSSSSSQYLDVSGDNGYSEVGTDLPTIGGSGWSVAESDTTGWTFEATFKLASVDSGACIFDFGNAATTTGQAGQDHVSLCISGTSLVMEVSNSLFGTRVALKVSYGSMRLSTNWYHVTVLVQPLDTTTGVARYEAYLNGQYTNSTNTGVWLRSTTRSQVYIGRSSVSGASYLNGYIDSIRVYDYALTAAEVLALYRAVTYNTTSTTESFYTTAPSISHTFDVSPPWSERNGGTTLTWSSGVSGRAGAVQLTADNSEWINLLTFPDRDYNLFPGYIGGRSISFEFWVMWLSFGDYTHLMDLSAVASSGGIYLDDIVISTLVQSDLTSPATLKFSLESGSSGVTDATVTITNAVYANVWNHLVCTIDVDRNRSLNATASATLQVFINGVLKGSKASIAPRYVNRAYSWLAKGHNSWNSYFNGYIDAFHYYNYEVELEAVRVHYVVPRPPLFEFVWAEAPFQMPGMDTAVRFGWLANDTVYSSDAGRTNHQGVLQFTASQGHYVDLTSSRSVNSMGTVIPDLGTLPTFSTLGQSYAYPGTASQRSARRGMSIELTFLYTSETGANGKLFSCSGSNGNDLIELGFKIGSRDLIFSVSNSDAVRDNSTTVITNAYYQRWFHVVVSMTNTNQNSFDSTGTWSVYIDGVLIGYYSNSVFPYATTRDTCALGRAAAGSSDSYLNGYLDSFRVFDYALNSTEVSLIYASINQVTDTNAGVAPGSSSTSASSSSSSGTSSNSASTGASSNSASSSTSLSSGGIAGAVIGSIVGVVVILALLVVYARWSKGRASSSSEAQKDGGPAHVELSEVRDDETHNSEEADA